MNDYNTQLFRLSAVLYADNNYEITPRTTHRKIIESVFIENNNKSQSIHEVIDTIHNNYHITFDYSEVLDIVTKESDCFISNSQKDNTSCCLTEKRLHIIKSKINNRTIDYFITLFEQENSCEVKPLIYRFLYELLSSNIASFKKLFENKKKIEELINVESHQYHDDEKETINKFLAWDNSDKNKAIFDIASYALEYCMIANKTENSIHLTTLKNKTFYLDTNVIFRVLGINGVNRQKRTTDFLQKFIEAGEILSITKFTEIEFKDSIKFYVNKLKRHQTKRLSPRVLNGQYFFNINDFFECYYRWRIGKVNDSYELFQASLFSEYESFKKQYKIDADYRIPFDEKEEKTIIELKEITDSISSHKYNEQTKHTFEGDYFDACNIHFVDLKREGKSTNIFSTKYFFISTDQSLRRWDYNRTSVTPIVILPSQWLSILLRYVNRTSDDFRSFVSFLNLPNAEKNISGEKLHIILAGISEITENFKQQEYLIQSLIQNKFDGLLENVHDEEQLFERAKHYAKSTLELELSEQTNKNEDLKTELSDLKTKAQTEIFELENANELVNKKIEEKDADLIFQKKLTSKLMENAIILELTKWRTKGYYMIIVLSLTILFELGMWLFTDSHWNFVSKFISYINAKGEVERDLAKYINLAIVGSTIPQIKFIYNRLFSKKHLEDETKTIMERIGKVEM